MIDKFQKNALEQRSSTSFVQSPPYSSFA